MSAQFKGNPNEIYDQETKDLYRLRPASDKEQIHNVTLHGRRSARGFVNPAMKLKDPKSEDCFKEPLLRNKWHLPLAGLFIVFASYQFSKAFFPYGFVLRASIPQSWASYFKIRAPMVAVGGYFWYISRYQTIQKLPDLTSENGD